MCLADKSFILGSHTKASACFTRYGCIHGPGSRVAVIFLIELVLFFFVLRMQIDIFCLRPLLAYVSGLASRRLEFKWFYDESFSHLSSSLVGSESRFLPPYILKRVELRHCSILCSYQLGMSLKQRDISIRLNSESRQFWNSKLSNQPFRIRGYCVVARICHANKL